MLSAVYQNIRSFYERVYWNWQEATTEHGAGYVLNYSGLSWLSGANLLWIDFPDALDGALIQRSIHFFRPYMADWSIVIVPEVQPGLRQRCYDYGCYLRWESPIMLLEGDPQIDRVASSTVIRRVRGDYLRHTARRIMGEVFNLGMDINRRYVRPEHEQDATFHHYVAFVDGHPAAASTLCYTTDMAGIWNVGTRRMFRRRGLAHALMARMCEDATCDGYTHTMLMASSMGLPIYQKMGYETVATAYYFGISRR